MRHPLPLALLAALLGALLTTACADPGDDGHGELYDDHLDERSANVRAVDPGVVVQADR